MDIIKRHWPLIAATAILWVAIGVLFAISVKQNEGHFVYALDDTYVNMAIAKNVAQHGVWGLTKHEFTPSSSSMLWVLILSLSYLIFGANEVSPLVFNILFATLTVFSVYWVFRRYKRFYTFLVLLGIIFFVPLPPLVLTGYEHILHALITILFVYACAKEHRCALLVLAPLLVLIRYEGLFLVFAACMFFALRKRWLYSFLLGALAIAPVGIYGIASVSRGWFWLPTPVFIKGYSPDVASLRGVTSFFNRGYLQLILNYHILFLTIAALILYVFRFGKGRGAWERGQIGIAIFLATAFLHVHFARIGSFYRYEAYLVALGIFVIGSVLLVPQEHEAATINISKRGLIPKYIAISLLFILFIRPFADRGILAFTTAPQATTNIYEQQYQMGLFLKEFYQGAPVVANDVGAINYLADIKPFDVWGLNNLPIAKMIRKGYYDENEIYSLIKSAGAKIAIVYDRWFDWGVVTSGVRYYKKYGINSQWAKVGQWKIANNKVCGEDTVSFYAVDPSERNSLIANLKQFSSKLPRTVKQSGEYTE